MLECPKCKTKNLRITNKGDKIACNECGYISKTLSAQDIEEFRTGIIQPKRKLELCVKELKENSTYLCDYEASGDFVDLSTALQIIEKYFGE